MILFWPSAISSPRLPDRLTSRTTRFGSFQIPKTFVTLPVIECNRVPSSEKWGLYHLNYLFIHVMTYGHNISLLPA